MEINFSEIHGVLWVNWTVETVTPLCIKSGTTSEWNQSPQPKARQLNASFNFFEKSSSGHTIADFYYDVFIDQNTQPRIRYTIPASSVRGALRGYTIRSLVKKDLWGAFLYPDESSPEFDSDALKDPGWQLIRNLFGLAWDTEDNIPDPTIAGRLRVMVEGPDELPENVIEGHLRSEGFNLNNVQYPSRHGLMLFTTRNPLDRITQAVKVGGLHSFMELAPGNVFTITLKILNPEPIDLGFVAFWEDAFNDGMLRIGGLTGAGRGRIKINSMELNLYAVTALGFPHFQKEAPSNQDDILIPIFQKYILSSEKWRNARKHYIDELKKCYKDLSANKEVANGSLHESV